MSISQLKLPIVQETSQEEKEENIFSITKDKGNIEAKIGKAYIKYLLYFLSICISILTGDRVYGIFSGRDSAIEDRMTKLEEKVEAILKKL